VRQKQWRILLPPAQATMGDMPRTFQPDNQPKLVS